jgi:hypothetical protein
MNDDSGIDDLRARMERLRRDLGHNVEQTVANARVMLDWRHYVASHPWLCLTGAAVAGFFLVPRRVRYTHLGPDALDELKARGLVVVRPAAAAASKTELSGFLAGAAARFAVRMIGSRIAKHLEDRLREGGG